MSLDAESQRAEMQWYVTGLYDQITLFERFTIQLELMQILDTTLCRHMNRHWHMIQHWHTHMFVLISLTPVSTYCYIDYGCQGDTY